METRSQFFLSPSLMATLLFLLFVGQTVMATKGQPLWKGTIYADVHGPTAKQVWPLFEDFCNVYRIFPVDVSFCVEGVPGHIGQRRYMSSKLPNGNTTFVSWEKHNLIALNPSKRFLTYEIMENNIPVKTYRSTMTVLSKKYGSQIKWAYVIDPIKGYTPELFRAQLKGTLQQAAANIEKAL